MRAPSRQHTLTIARRTPERSEAPRLRYTPSFIISPMAPSLQFSGESTNFNLAIRAAPRPNRVCYQALCRCAFRTLTKEKTNKPTTNQPSTGPVQLFVRTSHAEGATMELIRLTVRSPSHHDPLHTATGDQWNLVSSRSRYQPKLRPPAVRFFGETFCVWRILPAAHGCNTHTPAKVGTPRLPPMRQPNINMRGRLQHSVQRWRSHSTNAKFCFEYCVQSSEWQAQENEI